MKKRNVLLFFLSLLVTSILFMSFHPVGLPFKEQVTREKEIQGVVKLCKDYIKSFSSKKTNLIYRFRMDIPEGLALYESPESVSKEQVRGSYLPYGYGSGFEDAAYQNGLFLFTLCEAYDATGEPYFAELAQKVFKGLKSIGTLSPVPGFIVRGPHPVDGKSYYHDSSLDQHTLYSCGMWRFYHSKISTKEQKEFIRGSIDAIAHRMEKNDWVMLVEDNSREARAGGGNWKESDHLLLFMLAVAKDLTGDKHWIDEYEKYSNENDGFRWELLNEPISQDLPRYDYYMNQKAFRLNVLSRIEDNKERKEIAIGHMKRVANDMFDCNFLTHWKRRDWIGSLNGDTEANLFLKPLGYNMNSSATIFDFWNKYNPEIPDLQLPHEVEPRRYSGPTTMVPLMSWHIGLLSGDPVLKKRVHEQIPILLKRMDVNNIECGWVWNYAVVLALLDLAQ